MKSKLYFSLCTCKKKIRTELKTCLKVDSEQIDIKRNELNKDF